MKKIELAFELVNTMSLTRQYKGFKPYEMHDVNDMAQKVAARNSKDKIEALLDEELERQKKARKAYYKKVFDTTEEGKSMRNDMENAYEAWKNDIIEQINSTINEVLGESWGLQSFCPTSFTIALRDINPDTAAKDGGFYFGHKVEFYYGDYDGWTVDANREFTFKVNIGTMGSFIACRDDTQRDFYIGIGKLLSSGKLEELKDELKQFNENIHEAKKKFYNARNAYAEKMAA